MERQSRWGRMRIWVNKRSEMWQWRDVSTPTSFRHRPEVGSAYTPWILVEPLFQEGGCLCPTAGGRIQIGRGQVRLAFP